MQRTLCTLSAALLLPAIAAAQAPIFVDFGSGYDVTDVTVTNGEVIAVGLDSAQGTAFSWSSTTLAMTNLGAVVGEVHVSDDGTMFAATVRGLDGIDRASRWTGGTTWVAIPGLGSQSGTSETSAAGFSGDGSTIVGGGWVTAGTGHAFSSTGMSTVDLTPPFSAPSSRAFDVSDNGGMAVGWDQSQRYGVRWVSGVKTYFVHTAPNLMQYATGEAYAVNGAGTIAVGTKIFTLAPNDGWRWDAGTNAVTRLANVVGGIGVASPTDVSDDGDVIVGHTGGSFIFGTEGVIWIQNQPMRLWDHLINLGCIGAASFTDVGYVAAVSGDGNAMCGRGTGIGLGQPMGGWVVYFPGATEVGTVFCFGDGSGTACPCGNVGAANNGCASSVNASGAHLAAHGGLASLSNDNVILTGSGMPNSSALYFQGTSRLNGGNGTMFGDGLRCAGGTIVRLGTKSNVSGESHYPGTGDPSISVRGLVTAPGTRTYQCWYRNAAAFCTASTFNLTNGLELSWAP